MGEPEKFTTKEDLGGSAIGFANSNTVQGGKASDWVGEGVTLSDLLPYQYPSLDEIKASGVHAIYLGYYLKDFNSFMNAKLGIKNGLSFRDESLYDLGRYHRYSALDANINQINGWIKHVKFGYGSATDRASIDIREGKITREEGIALVKEFDGRCTDRFISEYCDFLGISVNEFNEIIEKYRGKMWIKDADGKWKIDSPIWEQEPVNKNTDIKKVIRRLNAELGIVQDIE